MPRKPLTRQPHTTDDLDALLMQLLPSLREVCARLSLSGLIVWEWRMAKGWSRTALARQAGVTTRTVARLESGPGLRTTERTIQRVTAALGRDHATLMAEVERRYQANETPTRGQAIL